MFYRALLCFVFSPSSLLTLYSHSFSIKGRFGMAILGEGDSLITQSSAQDLKLWLKMPSSELLDLPILKFLQVIRSQDIDIQVPALNCSGLFLFLSFFPPSFFKIQILFFSSLLLSSHRQRLNWICHPKIGSDSTTSYLCC